MRHGGQILVDHLKAQGIRRVFSVPGESFLAALDGLHDSAIQNIVCRHEGGAVLLVEAARGLEGELHVRAVAVAERPQVHVLGGRHLASHGDEAGRRHELVGRHRTGGEGTRHGEPVDVEEQ